MERRKKKQEEKTHEKKEVRTKMTHKGKDEMKKRTLEQEKD